MSDISIRVLAQAIPNHVWTATPEGRIDWFNDQVVLFTGRAREDLAGSGWSSMVHPDDVATASAAWQEALRGSRDYEVEFRIRRYDGVYRWHMVRGLPMWGEAGSLIGWVGSNTDIHDRKVAGNQSSRDRDRIWALSPVLKVVRSRDGLIQAVNPSWTRVLGWSLEQTVGRHALEFVQPDDHGKLCDPFNGQPLPERVVLNMRHASDGQRQIEWTAALEDDTLFSFGRDITAERQASEALASAQDALRQAQKMEAVGQLTGGLAHDFNNLLASISGSLEMLETRVAQGRTGDLSRYIATAQQATQRAATLTHRLLAFSRRQTLAPKPLQVNRVVAGLADMIRHTVGPAVEVEVLAADDLWTTLADQGQLENALLNLCINARDAMPDGGRVVIETANRSFDERAARERDLSVGAYVSMCVSDTGCGMTAEVIARAFDPFFTTKPIGMGTGLGLSMIYGFARQSGGQVRIFSSVGKGSTVCLYLPRHDGDAGADPVAGEREEAPRAARGETILVVDDEDTIRMLVADLLQELGYFVLEATDGASALELLAADTRVDLLLTDVGLPGGMNGRQVADAGRALRPSLKVLFITGYAEHAVIGRDQFEAGMQVLTKPFQMAELAERIRQLIALPAPGAG